MVTLGSYFNSTIGRKQLLGLSGIGLSLFILSHVAGNLLLFVGPKAYNLYSYALVSNPFIYFLEMGLLGIFIVHILNAFVVTLINQKARIKNYAVAPNGLKATSPVSRTMWYQGICIFIFIIIHIVTMKYGPHYEVSYEGQVVRDLFRLVTETFQQTSFMVGYSFCVIIVGFHVSHGLSSSLQTLGFHHPIYTKKIESISRIFGLLVGVGFLIQPIYFYFFYKG